MTALAGMTLSITIPMPAVLLSINVRRRMHWRSQAAHTKEQRLMAWCCALTLRSVPVPVAVPEFPLGQLVRVDVLVYPRKGQRSCDDLAMWEALKPTLDGLEDAGVVADDAQFVVGTLVWLTERRGELVLVLTQEV